MSPFLMNLASAAIVIAGLFFARPFMVPVLLAALVAFIATPLVRTLRKIKVPDALAIALTVLIFAIPFAIIGYAMVKQIQALIVDWPNILASSKTFVLQAAGSSWANKLHLSQSINLEAIRDKVLSRTGEGVLLALQGFAAFIDASSIFTLIMIFAIVMVAARRQLRQSFERLILNHTQSVVAEKLIDEVSSLIQNFLLARLIIIVVVGLAASLVLVAFHVKYALLLGSILGISTLIPNIGFILGLVPPLVVAAAQGHSFWNIFSIFICFALLGLIEGNVLTPKLVGGKLNINTLSAFIGLFAGGLMWGVWGMFLSIPLLGILRICLDLSPSTQAWAELLAEHSDQSLIQSLLRKATSKESPPRRLSSVPSPST